MKAPAQVGRAAALAVLALVVAASSAGAQASLQASTAPTAVSTAPTAVSTAPTAVSTAPTATAAGTPEGRFQAALASYAGGDAAGAAAAWQALLDEGHGGQELVYNLGNAYYRLGDAGRAVLNWERALRLDPLDRDARANLDFIRPRLADHFDVPVRLPVWDTLDGVLAGLPTGLLAWGGLLFALGAAGVAAFRYVVPERRLPAAARLLLTFLLVPAVSALVLLILQDRRLSHRPRGVVLADKVEVRAAPGSGATAQFDLHAGTTVVLLREGTEAWREIEVPDGRSGWVPPGCLEAVDLPPVAP